MSHGSVTVINTPWRSRNELLTVRTWLYGDLDPWRKRESDMFGNDADSKGATDRRHQRRKACDKIFAWKLRPPLPHTVESTWLITEAILADQIHTILAPASEGLSTFSVKAGYLTALTRFVTALLDASQTSKFKISMYTKAAEIGLPAMFVDLRHEATHGEMPTLPVLRDAAQKALDWLWEHYWSKLEAAGQQRGNGMGQEAEGVREGLAMGAEDALKAEGEVRPWVVIQNWEPRNIGTAN